MRISRYLRARSRRSRFRCEQQNPKLQQARQDQWLLQQREQEMDRAGEDWRMTERELDEMAANYYHEERNPLEEMR